MNQNFFWAKQYGATLWNALRVFQECAFKSFYITAAILSTPLQNILCTLIYFRNYHNHNHACNLNQIIWVICIFIIKLYLIMSNYTTRRRIEGKIMFICYFNIPYCMRKILSKTLRKGAFSLRFMSFFYRLQSLPIANLYKNSLLDIPCYLSYAIFQNKSFYWKSLVIYH